MASGMIDCWRVRRPMSSHKLWAWRVGLALLCLTTLALAQFKPAYPPAPPQQPPVRQPQPSAGQPTFSVKVNLVRLLVSVRDQFGGLLTNLDKQDFRVLDDGVPQDVAVFERNTSLPLSVAIMIDTSGSTQQDLHYEVASVLKFIPALLQAGNPADSFALFSFNWRTNLEVDFSRNQHRAERALHALRGEGGTSLYDAIYLASDSLEGREGRHVMVVVTDGGDTTSYKHYNDALAAAQRADVVMYPIVVIPIASDAGRNLGGEHALATLSLLDRRAHIQSARIRSAGHSFRGHSSGIANTIFAWFLSKERTRTAALLPSRQGRSPEFLVSCDRAHRVLRTVGESSSTSHVLK